jgi:pyruvate kinase
MEIIATIGPATNSPSMIRKLWCAGVTTFRLNLSYTDETREIEEFIINIDRETDAKICIDTHGRKYSNLDYYKDKEFLLTNFDKKIITDFYDDITILAISFVHYAKDIEKIKKINNNSKINLMAKIEDNIGFMNHKEIIEASDSILIDRGDLAKDNQSKIESIPSLCHIIIKECKEQNKPVYIATNVLETMLEKPIPSIGEVNDIDSLLKSGINGIVLAGETAIGKYPIECVMFIKKMMNIYGKDA